MQASLASGVLSPSRPTCSTRQKAVAGLKQPALHAPQPLARQRVTGACAAALSGTRAISGQPHAAQSLRSRHSRPARSSTVVRAAQGAGIRDRAVAAAPYLVPLFDGLRYGKFALAQNPLIYNILAPLDPLIRLYTTVPFASLIVFFAIYIGIINQRDTWSRYVRFNAMQAILLDIVLILPGVFEQVLKPPMSGFGLTVYINIYNSIFFFVLACWLYGSGACLLGQTARLPLVADAADQQVPY